MTKLTRRSLLGTAVGAAAITAAPRRARADTELIVTVPGGSLEDGWRKSVIAPFEAANPGIKAKIIQGLTFQNVALMRAQKGDVSVDVIMMDDVASSEAAAEGLTERLTMEAVPNLANLFPEFRVAGDLYTKIYWVPEVIAYNTNLVKPAPTSWAELWEPRFKGRLAVPNLDTSTGILFFLMVNKIHGGTLENVEPAFAALKTLKANVTAFPTQHAQQAQLFSQGDVIIAPWVPDRTRSLAQTGQPVAWILPKEGSVMAEGTLAIAKGTKKLDAALKYVNFAISGEAQALTARYANLPPVSAKAVLDAETKAAIPNGPDMLKLIGRPDWKLVNQHRAAWIDRWNREIVG
jgi:putative spermidine/putrescine transport system substrate-binding protein